MRTLLAQELTEYIKTLFLKANTDIGRSLLEALERASENEVSPLGRSVLKQILENDRIAKRDALPLCQDTGMAVVFVEFGQDVHIEGGAYEDAIQEGVRQAYKEGYLRKSVVKDPLFERTNTQDNTPAIIHTRIVPGEALRITVTPKGFGSENMSTIKLLPPSAGIEGVKSFILEHLDKVAVNACPPLVVGIGIGGTFETAALLAKQAVLRGPDQPSPDLRYARLEEDLLEAVNRLGVGPAGLGGRTTALAVNIEPYPTHIASIPVAINVCCHAARHAQAVL